jgi:hydrogenase maturation protease
VTEPKPVHILGLGNILMSDDGFGPYAARVLEATYELPDEVNVQDAGTPGLDLTPYVAGARAVIVIDTVTGGEAPGTLKTYDRTQLLATPPPDRTSPHQPGLREALMACELTDTSPDNILVVGVVPESIETGTGLTSTVRAAVAPAVATVIEALERLGVAATPRAEPVDPDIWWES